MHNNIKKPIYLKKIDEKLVYQILSQNIAKIK